MDIRLALNEATSSGNGTGSSVSHQQHHHHHSFFHHHGSISIHLNSSNSAPGQQTVANNLASQQPIQQSTQSHLHNFISGSATSALNALMGHHHHHHHNHNSTGSSSSNSNVPPLTLRTTVANASQTNPSTSASGSQSAGVLGSISFGLPSASASSGGGGQDQQQLHQYQQNLPHSPTPPLQRRLAKSFSVAPNLTQQKGAILAVLLLLHTFVQLYTHTHTFISICFYAFFIIISPYCFSFFSLFSFIQHN